MWRNVASDLDCGVNVAKYSIVLWIVFIILQSLSLSRSYSPVGPEGPLIQTPHVVLCGIWQLSGECCVLDLEYISYPGLWIIAYKGGVLLVTGVNEFLCNICRDALHMLAIKGRWWKASLSADINCCLRQMPILLPGR